jgi:hypothetical protein
MDNPNLNDETEVKPETVADDASSTIVFNQNEKNLLIQLIDLAVKAGGLNVAEAGLHFLKKLE